MRCKKHITDGSSRVGVCASCLRERLFLLVEAQARSAAAVLSLQQQQQQIEHEYHRKSDSINNYHSTQPQQPPLIYPRSVSPYICRRRSDIVEHQNQNSRFYTTPQLGNTNPNDTANTNNTSSSSATHKKKNRFRILSNLFRSSNRSVVVIDEPEPQIPDPPSTISRASLSTSSPITSSSTWYSSLIPNSRKTTQESPCRSTNHHHHRPRHHHRNKGLSPNYTEEEDNIGGGGEEDINNIGYVSESSPGWRKSTTTTTPGRQRRGGQNGNNSKSVSMTFCLSPLVRASPKRSSHKKDGGGFSGEIRVSSSVHNHRHHHNPNLSTAASFCANRSIKIANFGRYNNNP